MFAAIRGWFAGLPALVASFFAGPGGAIVKEALANATQVAGSVALALLMERAKDYVSTIDQEPVPSEMKAAHARDYLQRYAAGVGIKTSTALLNFVIETAVQSLRAPKE